MRSRFLCSLCGVLFFCLGLSAQSLQVVDAEGHSTTLTAAQLAKASRVTVNVRDHDTPATFEGAPLAAAVGRAMTG